MTLNTYRCFKAFLTCGNQAQAARMLGFSHSYVRICVETAARCLWYDDLLKLPETPTFEWKGVKWPTTPTSRYIAKYRKQAKIDLSIYIHGKKLIKVNSVCKRFE